MQLFRFAFAQVRFGLADDTLGAIGINDVFGIELFKGGSRFFLVGLVGIEKGNGLTFQITVAVFLFLMTVNTAGQSRKAASSRHFSEALQNLIIIRTESAMNSLLQSIRTAER